MKADGKQSYARDAVWRSPRNKPQLSRPEVPQPKPGPGDLLIRVHAAGVTPTELVWSPTTQKKDGSPRTNAIPAHEFSGVVAEVGADVRDFRLGQEIYGMNDWFADGALAEFCITQPASIAPKPTISRTPKPPPSRSPH